MSHKKHITTVVGVLTLFAIIMFFDMRSMDHTRINNTTSKPTTVSMDVWSITLTDINGNIVPLTNFMGVPVVIQSWSTLCLFCTQEMPALVNYQQEFSKTVQFVAVNRGESSEKVRSFLDTHDANHDLNQLLDEGDLFYTSIEGVTEPETLFISANGELILQAQGPISDHEMRKTISKMLQ